MTDKWQWWSGMSDELYTQGPFASREIAIEEAFRNENVMEEQIDGTNIGHVFIIEARGTFFDCDECGVVEKACDACTSQYDTPAFYFRETRNHERITRHLNY